MKRPRSRRLAGCRPGIELLEERAVAASLPLVVVPGQPGSFPILNRRDPAGALADIESFLLNEGQPPGSLTWDFAIHTRVLGTRINAVSPYVPFVHYLERHGYTLGQNLFVAVADWRLPVAPTDGAADGVLTAETNAQLTGDSFAYGVDYLAYAIRQASQTWAEDHGGVPPPAVDVVSHSYGYFVTRAYLASPGYGSPALPRINDFISMGGANDGVSIAYNWLNDNFVGPGSSLREGGLYPILNVVYKAVASGAATVNLPGGRTITARSIEDAQGQPSPTLFIRQYIPSFADFMATYNFLGGQNVNNDPAFRNNLLLDVNPASDPNRFATEVGHVWAVYGTTRPTPTKVATRVGRGGKVLPLGRPVFSAHSIPTGPGQVWYRDRTVRHRGDSLIPTFSAVSTFAGDPRITLMPLRGVTHSSMLTTPRVVKRVLRILKRSG